MKIESNTPLVTFGLVNCNRLFYLKSCFESLYKSTNDYPNREFIVVDNASVEAGTEDYLKSLESRGVNVLRQKERDPSNEFAKGLNLICGLAKGKYICPLQGDMQFIAKNLWLQEYVDFYEAHYDSIGCIMFDAQRNITNIGHKNNISQKVGSSNFKFVLNNARPPISGAADVMYSRKVIDLIYPWYELNVSHEGGQDSETAMLQKSKLIMDKLEWRPYCAASIIPVSVAIYTDSRGTNGRIRGNRRYGDYWEAKDPTGVYYYQAFETSLLLNELPINDVLLPFGIETIAKPIGHAAPIDSTGSWLKNPIRPETAKPSDYVELVPVIVPKLPEEKAHINDWLSE